MSIFKRRIKRWIDSVIENIAVDFVDKVGKVDEKLEKKKSPYEIDSFSISFRGVTKLPLIRVSFKKKNI